MQNNVRSSIERLDRLAASRDLWPLGTLDGWQGRRGELPERVFWPASADEVATVLRDATREGVEVVPFGAGSGVCGGAAGRAGSWVLDTKGLDAISDVDTASWSVTAGAGVLGQHLEDHLQSQGFTLGHSPSSLACSTVGGWAAARSAGQFSSRYGAFEDMVLGLQAVSPTRGVFEVGAGGTAPDHWMDLLLGSEGTLAVITRVTMRVWPVPGARWLRGYHFRRLDDALDAMRRVVQGELHPAVLRLYDPVDTRIGGRTRPKRADGRSGLAARWLSAALARIDAAPGVKPRTLALPLALPGLLNRVASGLSSGCLLIAGWEGEAEGVEALSEEGHRILCERGADLGEEPGERWYRSRHAVSYKLMPIFERGGFADTMEVAAPWSLLPEVYRSVRAALGRTTVVMAHMSHMYPEGGCIYFSFAGRGDRDVYGQTWEAALSAVLAAGGTLSHHHGVGLLKARHAAAEIGPAIAGWRALKEDLDPDGLLNAGRVFVDAGLQAVEPSPRHPPEDHLARSASTASVEERSSVAEPSWPWRTFPGLPRWQRLPWQTPWVEVAGFVDGVFCRLGRGPRSAVGPDLRRWLAEHADSRVTWATAPAGDRWLGVGTPEQPWEVALALLRSDLRPAILTVRAGELLVGFRGPAATALGAMAARRVPGGLVSTPWRLEPLPSGPMCPCDSDDPRAAHVTTQGVFRLVEEEL
ncbi:MAG: FAD-binding oxidoreductase [Myxococcales bacterium]|nr:FAD-binding oxidoreductase [Myxococcales bacterium]